MRRKQTEKTVQLTVRGVPQQVKKRLSMRATSQHKSLNELLVEAICLAAGVESVHGDLDHLIGNWIEDPAFDEAIRAQDQVDESLWR